MSELRDRNYRQVLFLPADRKISSQKQTVWHLIQHFFSDITHFDGKFFCYRKRSFCKTRVPFKGIYDRPPGELSESIRMYIFTSAIFFLIFFALFDVKNMHVGADTRTEIEKDPDLKQLISKAKNAQDSIRILKEYNSTATPLIKLDEDSTAQKTKGVRIPIHEADYQSAEAYDSVQRLLPENKRDGWVRHKLKRRTIELSRSFERKSCGIAQRMA